MFFGITSSYYLARYNDNLILLNVFTSKYYVIDKINSQRLEALLSSEFEKVEGGYQRVNISGEAFEQHALNEYIQNYIKKKILSPILHKYPYVFDRKISAGVESLNEYQAYVVENKRISISEVMFVFKALILFFITSIELSFFGLFAFIEKLRISSKRKEKKKWFSPNLYVSLEKELLRKIIRGVKIASIIYPGKITCLEWSIVLTKLCMRKNIPCQFVIGVQTPPFQAHAWVEYAGNVIEDDEELPSKLANILREPKVCDI